MSDLPAGIVILGAGRWGLHLARNFLAHPQARVVAIVDLQPQRLAQIGQLLQLDRRDQPVVLTDDWQAALRLPGVDGVAIATPASTHYQLIQAALRQGLHVLAEKPLTLDVAEAQQLCDLAAQQQRQLVIDHTYLFHPVVQQGSAFLQTGKLGQTRYGYAARTHLGPIRQDVDALWDLAIHDIAIFNQWLGSRPVQVQAQGTVWLQYQSPNPHQFPQGLADLVWVTLTYPEGLQVMIHLCWCNPDKQRRLCLTGDRGTLVFDELYAAAPLRFLPGQVVQADGQFLPDQQPQMPLTLEPVEPLRQVCDHFLTCLQQNQPSLISSGEVGAGLVQILVALNQSLQQNGVPVTVEGQRDQS